MSLRAVDVGSLANLSIGLMIAVVEAVARLGKSGESVAIAIGDVAPFRLVRCMGMPSDFGSNLIAEGRMVINFGLVSMSAVAVNLIMLKWFRCT